MKKINSRNKDGEITPCNACGSIYHCTKSCPDLYENQMQMNEETNITLTGKYIDTLKG